MYDVYTSYTNEFDVANEGLNLSKSKIIAHIENFFTHAIEFLRRLIINLKRLRKFTIPRQVDETIRKLTYQIFDIYMQVDDETSTVEEISQLAAAFSDIIQSQEYLNVMTAERDDFYSDDLIPVNVNNVIIRINEASKMLVDHKTKLINMISHDDTIDHTNVARLDISITSHLMKLFYRYFAFGVEKKEKPVKGLTPLEEPIEVNLVMR